MSSRDNHAAPMFQASPATERSIAVRSVLAATLLPLAAFVVQLLIWQFLLPYAWLIFFPTVFLAAWLGGFASGVGATLLSTALVWWRFVPPEGALVKEDPKYLLSPAVFILMGFAVSVLQRRLWRANQARAAALAESKQSQREQQFLAEAGSILASSLDYDQTLTSVARLAVREFADVSFVDLIEENGEIRRLRAVCRDPSLNWACEILSNTPLNRDRPYFTGPSLKTQRPILMESLSPETVVSFAQENPERLRALRAIDPKSAITVPLMADGKAFGMLAFVSSASSRRLTADDLRLAEALAHRAALAIAKARLYRRALQARDEVLVIVAHDLRNPLSTIVMEAELFLKHRLGEQEPDFRDAALSIHRSAVRMNRMIQDLLDISAATGLDCTAS